jgi:hypothetical protein
MSPATIAAPARGDGETAWISGQKARARLNVGYGSLVRLALLGRIRTRIEPGIPAKYSARDVEAIAASRS